MAVPPGLVRPMLATLLHGKITLIRDGTPAEITGGTRMPLT